MSAKRPLRNLGAERGARSLVYPLVAAGALAAALFPGSARAQELVYCDLAEQAQWVTKLQQNADASVIFSGERRKIGIRLTEEKASQRGTAFHKLPLAFAPGDSLYAHFRLRISGGGGNMPPSGGEGMAFVLTNDMGGDPQGVGKLGSGPKVIGAGGDGFGYKGIAQSLALEFDTLMDASAGDPDGNHLSLDLGGLINHTSDGTAGGAPLTGMAEGSTVAPWQPITLNALNSLESNSTSYDTRDVWLDYVCSGPGSCSLSVYMTFNNAAIAGGFSDSTKPATLLPKPATPIMVVNGLQDISNYLGGNMGYAGFTASTGSTMDEHLILYWVMGKTGLLDTNVDNLEDACQCKTIPACNGNVPICDASSPTGLGFCRDCLNDNECAVFTPGTPICNSISLGGTGSCVECNLDVNCPADRPFCNAPIHTCTANCTDDTMCAPAKWCDNPSGMPYSGTCTDDLPNGSAIPSSGNHTPLLDGKCTPEAAAVVCVSAVCDTKDNKCGLTLGQKCASATGAIECRSGVCTGAGTCGCENDAECLDPASGVTSNIICDDVTRLCQAGCRTMGGNGCPEQHECSAEAGEIGECIKLPDPLPPGVSRVDGGYVEGTGIFKCGTSTGPSSAAGPAALLFLAACAGHLARRRRRDD